MKRALIVIDMQNDFISGSLGSEEAEKIVANVKAKVAEYKERGDAVIFTRDTHYDNYLETQEGKFLPVKHCVKSTDGWNISGELGGYADNCVDKETFGHLGWDKLLGEFGEIELCGLCTDICVVTNALIIKTQFPETPLTVDANCCAGVTGETHRAALVTMKQCHVNVVNM